MTAEFCKRERRFGVTQEPSYLAMNPNARLPTVEHGGLMIWESNVIVSYLAHTFSDPILLPGVRQSRAHGTAIDRGDRLAWGRA